MAGTVRAGSTLEVGPSQPYATISAAMNDANDGDTILVHTGVYDEAVIVNKVVSIIGAPSEVGAKLVQKSGSNVFTVTVPWVNITGLTIEEGKAGIAITETGDNCRIEGCNLTNNERGVSIIGLLSGTNPVNGVKIGNCTFNGNSMSGIYAVQAVSLRIGANEIHNTGAISEASGMYLNGGQDARIENNTVSGNSKTGVYLFSMNEARVENNTASDNGLEGILLKNSQDVVMRDNSMLDNKYDLSVEGLYGHDIAQSNSVSGGKVYYYTAKTGLTVPSDAGYVGMYQCSDMVVEDLSISKVGQGVLIANSYNIVVEQVAVQDCLVGIDMTGSYSNSVEWCNISQSFNYGIRIFQGSGGIYGGNVIENTTISGSNSPVFGRNIFISTSESNRIIDCNISASVGIGVHIFDKSDNCELIRTTVTYCESGAAVAVDGSKDVLIANNKVVNNDFDGIQVTSGSTGAMIRNNVVQENDLGLGNGEGIRVMESGSSTVSNNVVSGNKLGIIIESSDDCDVENNTVSGHVDRGGIWVRGSSSAKVMNNLLSDNEIGIEVSGSTTGSPNLKMVLADNNVQGSEREGISIIGTVTDALIHGNVVSGAGPGFYTIYMGPSTSQSLIYDNSFTGEDNANDEGAENRWNVTKTAGTNVVGGEWIAGNYYSNNTGVDADMDGIFDSSYLVGQDRYDYLPLFLVDRASSPRNLTVTNGDREVKLTWDAPESDGGWPLIGYNVYRGTDPSNLVLYTTLAVVLEFTDTNVTNGLAYFYQVAAVNPEKIGVMSGMVAALPAALPSAPNLVATPGNGYVNLTWAPPVSTGGGPIVSYNIYRGGAPFVLLAEVNGGQLYFNDTSVTNRVTYSYQISANNTSGEGPRSATAVAMPNWPASMPIINITSPSEDYMNVTEVEVAWDMSDSGSGVAYCEIRLDSQGWINLSLAQSYTFNNLSQGPHIVEVRATNNAGFSNNATKGFTVDNVAPQVVSTYPSGDAAPVTQNVTIEFNENMEQATATIDGEVMTVTIVGKEVRCSIPFDIDLDTTYMVMVNGSDLAGNQMAAPYFFNFTTTDKVKVTGRVIDSDGKPVGGADVNIGGYATTSDPEGNFTMYVPPGRHPITIEADGLDPYIDNVTVSSTGGNLGTFLTAGSQNEQDDTNWLMLIGGIAGLAAGVVLLVLVFRMMKKSKKEEGKPPAQ